MESVDSILEKCKLKVNWIVLLFLHIFSGHATPFSCMTFTFTFRLGQVNDGILHNVQTHSLDSHLRGWFLWYVNIAAIINSIANNRHVTFLTASVESALSYGAKKSGKRFGRKYHLASLRILASLSQTNPLCADVFNRCYPKCPPKSVDHSKTYLLCDMSSQLEYSILWIRACLVEKKLMEIVQVFIDNAQ